MAALVLLGGEAQAAVLLLHAMHALLRALASTEGMGVCPAEQAGAGDAFGGLAAAPGLSGASAPRAGEGSGVCPSDEAGEARLVDEVVGVSDGVRVAQISTLSLSSFYTNSYFFFSFFSSLFSSSSPPSTPAYSSELSTPTSSHSCSSHPSL